MKVVKLVRFKSKDKNGFVKNDTFEVVRERAIVEDSAVTESHESYQETGLYYVVDEAATKARDEQKAEKAKGPKAPKLEKVVDEAATKTVDPELEAARARFTEIAKKDPNKIWGVKKLNEEIEKLQAAK